MPDSNRPRNYRPGDPIRADDLRKYSANAVQRLSVVGGNVSRHGTAYSVGLDKAHLGLPVLYRAVSSESGGTIQVKRVKSDGTVVGGAITVKVLP